MRTHASILSLLLGTGCIIVTGDDSGERGSTTGDAPGESTGADSTAGSSPGTAAVDSTGSDTLDGICEPEETCVPRSRPVGWTGPFALRRDDGDVEGPQCDGIWSSSVGSYYLGFDPGQGSCVCGCEAASDVTCDAVAVEHDLRAGCPAVDDTVPLAVVGACVATGWDPAGSARIPEIVAQGQCAAAGAPAKRIPAGFAERLTLCNPGPVEVCDDGDGTCAPPLPEGYETLCIFDKNDTGVSCDETAPFSVEIVANAWLVDNRHCTDVCSCELDDATCGAQVTAFSTPDCVTGTETGMLTDDSGCAALDTTGLLLEDVTPPAGSCSPTEATVPPAGTVEPGVAVRMCCIP